MRPSEPQLADTIRAPEAITSTGSDHDHGFASDDQHLV
jgi:hypothetical protein